jgi:hypothetical protein
MKTHQKPTVKPTPTHSPPEKPNPAWCGFSNRKPTPTHIIPTSIRAQLAFTAQMTRITRSQTNRETFMIVDISSQNDQNQSFNDQNT